MEESEGALPKRSVSRRTSSGGFKSFKEGNEGSAVRFLKILIATRRARA